MIEMKIEQYLEEGKDFPTGYSSLVDRLVINIHYQTYDRLRLREIDEDVIHMTMSDGNKLVFSFVGRDNVKVSSEEVKQVSEK